MAVIYVRKLFMQWTPVANVINLFTVVNYEVQ
jgi:hypothetical protein